MPSCSQKSNFSANQVRKKLYTIILFLSFSKELKLTFKQSSKNGFKNDLNDHKELNTKTV